MGGLSLLSKAIPPDRPFSGLELQNQSRPARGA